MEKWVSGLDHILSAELYLPLSPSFPLLLLFTAGAPNCIQGDVWVEGVSLQGLQLN